MLFQYLYKSPFVLTFMERGNQLDLVFGALKQKQKIVVMLAPSFVAEFNYPDLLVYLKKAGFDKLVELTFGAKLVNKEYHKFLDCKQDCFWISSVCPGIVYTIQKKYSKYVKNLIPVVSPMIATARLCKKLYPQHKILFISPCHMKKLEAQQNRKDVDYVLDYQELKQFFSRSGIDISKPARLNESKPIHFDKFYNDYTKIYPLAGGLSKTAHLKGILAQNQTKIIDGVLDVEKFLKNPDKKIKFLDVNFCIGGCIGGPCLAPEANIEEKKKRVLAYVEKAKHEKISKADRGILKRAEGLNLKTEF